MRLSALVVCLIVYVSSAAADTVVTFDWWSAKVTYSATLTELPQRGKRVGRLYFDRGKVRHETIINDALFVAIYLPEDRRQYIFTPEGTAPPLDCIDYMDFIEETENAVPYSSEAVRQEILNGEEVTKYRLVFPDGQSSDTSFAWITGDGIVMRTAAADGEVITDLSQVSREPLQPGLFDLPYGVPLCTPGRMD
jgi:hypothetical protein